MRAVFDTNIIIDYLNGEKKAQEEIECYEYRAISIITYIEVLADISNTPEEETIKQFLLDFSITEVNQQIAELTIRARKKHRLKIPDAIIFATAEFNQCLLVTRNTKDFPVTLPLIRIPYTLK